MRPYKSRSVGSSSYLQEVSVRHYRLYRISIRDDGGEGWNIRVYPPNGEDGWELRSGVPGGLDELLSQARQSIDRRLDSEVRYQQS